MSSIADARLDDGPQRVALLVGMPRSGTSWLAQIVDSCPAVRFRMSPLFSHAFKNRLGPRASASEWWALFDQVYRAEDDFMSQVERRRRGDYPTFERKLRRPPVLAIKMTRFHHLLEPLLDRVRELRLCCIVRHPCGAIHSWLSTPGEFPAGADPAAEWRSGACRKTGVEEFWGFEDWKRVTRLHLELARRFPERVLVLRYERLVQRAEPTARTLFEFLELPFERQCREFLAESQRVHRVHSHAVFKHPAVSDRWRQELQPAIRDAILGELRGTDLEAFIR